MDTPLGYFITFRTYGTWVHGDSRGSIDDEHRGYRQPFADPDPARKRYEQSLIAHAPVILNPRQRDVCSVTIIEVCRHRKWALHAHNVRTNHIHVVVTAAGPPEPVMNALKSWCTRRLRETGLIPIDQRLWSRHGSTPHLWTDDQLRQAIEYVTRVQDDPALD
jgi:REP element-mobilizing transposase RayT